MTDGSKVSQYTSLPARNKSDVKTTCSECYTSPLTAKQQGKLTKLIGEKCIVVCCLDGTETKALWDTGSQVSLVHQGWVEKNRKTLRPISEITGDRVNLRAANGTVIPYIGWVDLKFNLPNPTATVGTFIAPFLIVNDNELQQPIIGYNVIKEFVTLTDKVFPSHKSADYLQGAFPTKNKRQLDAIVNFIQTAKIDVFSEVKSGEQLIVVPKKSQVNVKCMVRLDTELRGKKAFFEPVTNLFLPEGLVIEEALIDLKPSTHKLNVRVTNITNHPLQIPNSTVLGNLEHVRAVFPLPENKRSTAVKIENQSNYVPEVDLSKSNLTREQETRITELLLEQADAFAKDKDDVGCAPQLQMDIKLVDDVPVQKNYISIPRPLYTEVKAYLCDLIQKGWINKSRLNYSSPMVCVRKKGCTLRLCID